MLVEQRVAGSNCTAKPHRYDVIYRKLKTDFRGRELRLLVFSANKAAGLCLANATVSSNGRPGSKHKHGITLELAPFEFARLTEIFGTDLAILCLKAAWTIYDFLLVDRSWFREHAALMRFSSFEKLPLLGPAVLRKDIGADRQTHHFMISMIRYGYQRKPG